GGSVDPSLSAQLRIGEPLPPPVPEPVPVIAAPVIAAAEAEAEPEPRSVPERVIVIERIVVVARAVVRRVVARRDHRRPPPLPSRCTVPLVGLVDDRLDHLARR